MPATSTKNPTSPVQHRDIRSASLPFKRDKEHAQKWSNGQRPLAGVRANFNAELEDTESQLPLAKEKVRPMKQWSQTCVLPPIHHNPKY